MNRPTDNASAGSKKQQMRESAPPPVPAAAPRSPMQSQIDEQRSDWEGMGQGRFQPETEAPAAPAVGVPSAPEKTSER